jgi:hypothetical protein
MSDQDIPSRPGFKLVHKFDVDDPIVSMVVFHGRVIVSTKLHIYVLTDNMIERLELWTEPSTPSPSRSPDRAK